jgi:hydroxymethylpyrimidine/phosphomethylpyrimidine kinase
MRLSSPPRALVIGGWDPTGGAGLAADLAVLTGHGVTTSGAISALTSQGPEGLRALEPTSAGLLAQQIADALRAAPPHVVKIGLLPDAATVEAVADALAEVEVPIVLDPVLGVSAGGWSLDAEGCSRLAARLVPRAAVVTPNGPEAVVLAGLRGGTARDALDAGCWLSGPGGGGRALVVTGGHGTGPDIEDLLAVGGAIVARWSAPRIDGGPFHGTGCAFASSLAARLAHGAPLREAVGAARDHVRGLVRLAATRGAWRLPFALLRAGVEAVEAPPVS